QRNLLLFHNLNPSTYASVYHLDLASVALGVAQQEGTYERAHEEHTDARQPLALPHLAREVGEAVLLIMKQRLALRRVVPVQMIVFFAEVFGIERPDARRVQITTIVVGERHLAAFAAGDNQ